MIIEKNKLNIDEIEDSPASDKSFDDTLRVQHTTQALKQSVNPEKRFTINNSILLDIISDQTKAKFIWKCVSGSLLAVIILSGFMCFNLYKSNENLEDKIVDYAKLETKFAESKAENDRLKSEIFEANNEIKSAKSESNKFKTQNNELQEELNTVSKQLKDLQVRNAEVVKILNGRLQKLSD